MPHLMQLSNDYREISGYKTIASKSEAMMLSGVWPSQLENQFRFHLSREDFRYLDVIITPSTTKLYRAYYGKFMKETNIGSLGWEILPSSLIGRIETV